MKLSILPNTLEQGIHPHASSARIRGEWVAKYLNRIPGWSVSFKDPSQALHASVIIFQKYYVHPSARELARTLTRAGKVVVLDLCDSDWEDTRKLPLLMEMLQNVSAAIGSSHLISSWLSHHVPSFTIPDGVDLEACPPPKSHSDSNPLRLVWFGNRSNFHLIEGKEVIAQKQGCVLETISDHPKATKKWSIETVLHDILVSDIFWDPRGHGLSLECKTNNKELQAWALGLPVIHEEGLGPELQRFRTASSRTAEARSRMSLVKTHYEMSVLARQWSTTLKSVYLLSKGIPALPL